MSRPYDLTSLSGFDASLRLLILSERYSLSDVGMMFGATGEAIRLHCKRLGIANPDGGHVGLHAVRVWDDAANRFRPVARGEIMATARRSVVARRRAERQRVIAARRARMVAAITQLRESLHREPSHREMWIAVGGDPTRTNNFAPMLSNLWGRTRHDGITAALRELHEATGTRPRGAGGAGHVGSRRLRSHCRTCGEEIKTYPSGYRDCPRRWKHARIQPREG